MDELNRNKFWFAIGRSGVFTEKDNHIFRVWPRQDSYDKNQSWDLMPKFVEAEGIEDARQQIHRFVDKMFGDFYIPADKQSGTYVPPPPTPSPMQGLDSLTIGGDVESTKEPKANTEGLLNLGDL